MKVPLRQSQSKPGLPIGLRPRVSAVVLVDCTLLPQTTLLLSSTSIRPILIPSHCGVSDSDAADADQTHTLPRALARDSTFFKLSTCCLLRMILQPCANFVGLSHHRVENRSIEYVKATNRHVCGRRY